MLVKISILSMTSCASSLLFGRVGYFFLRSPYRASAPFLISLGCKWLSSKVCSSFLTTADGRLETSPEFFLDRMRSCLASVFRTVGSYPQTYWFLALMIATLSESVVIDFVQFFFMLHIYTMSPFLRTFILLYIYPYTIMALFPLFVFMCVISMILRTDLIWNEWTKREHRSVHKPYTGKAMVACRPSPVFQFECSVMISNILSEMKENNFR